MKKIGRLYWQIGYDRKKIGRCYIGRLAMIGLVAVEVKISLSTIRSLTVPYGQVGQRTEAIQKTLTGYYRYLFQ